MKRQRRNRRPAHLVCLVLSLALLSACASTGNPAPATLSAGQIQVVAVENFYGNLVQQLGGSHVAVTSIFSDPNVDPHEYEATVQTGIAVSQAQLIIENGGGYDSWMDKLLTGIPSAGRLLIRGYDIAPTHLPENEHVWYSLTNIAAIAQGIAADLQRLDPADAPAFAHNLQVFKHSLLPLQQTITDIKQSYAGTPVGLTETIYLYQARLEDLNILTPFAFEKAVAEGNDPPTDAVITATNQINNRQIKLLISNAQTVTPVTAHLASLASAQHIPIVQVSETMPPGQTYQSWMMAQLQALETALKSQA